MQNIKNNKSKCMQIIVIGMFQIVWCCYCLFILLNRKKQSKKNVLFSSSFISLSKHWEKLYVLVSADLGWLHDKIARAQKKYSSDTVLYLCYALVSVSFAIYRVLFSWRIGLGHRCLDMMFDIFLLETLFSHHLLEFTVFSSLAGDRSGSKKAVRKPVLTMLF